MRTNILLVIATAALGFVSGQQPSNSDVEKYQGAWQATFMIDANGSPVAEDEVRNSHLLVEGDRFTLRTKDAVIKGTFTLDPSRTPKAIDVVLDGQKPEEKLLGIYQIDGELRKSCFALSGMERPKDFDPKAKNHIQFGWKPRAK